MAVPFAVITLLLVAVISVLIIRTGAIALTMTGVSEEVATFQAASAFSGAGFTTQEAEDAISTPQRRRIVGLLIRSGSIGIVTAIASLVLSFSHDSGTAAPRFLYLLIGAGVIVWFAQSNWFNRLLAPLLRQLLEQTTSLDETEYAHLLKLRDDYRVTELTVREDDWLTSKSLRELDLFEEGVVVLGVHRNDGTYVSPPDPDAVFQSDEVLVVYGRKNRVAELSTRADDDRTAHEEAVREQKQETEADETQSDS